MCVHLPCGAALCFSLTRAQMHANTVHLCPFCIWTLVRDFAHTTVAEDVPIRPFAKEQGRQCQACW